MNASTSSASGRSRSSPTPITSTRAACTARRSATCATASRASAGFVVITGEIGSGKTTLLQSLLRSLDSETTVARIVNTMLDPRELLEAILLDFGLDVPQQQARDAARAGRVPGRGARGRAPRAARHRRGAEPRSRRARGSAHAVEPRDREVEAHSDRPGRAAGPAGHARPPRSSSSCGSGSPSATTCRRSTPTTPRPTSTTGWRAPRSARRWPFRARSPTWCTPAVAVCRASST